MKARKATVGELLRFHEDGVRRSEAEIRAARRALSKAQDRRRHHQEAIGRLERSERKNG